jgi:hypothetical protein
MPFLPSSKPPYFSTPHRNLNNVPVCVRLCAARRYWAGGFVARSVYWLLWSAPESARHAAGLNLPNTPVTLQ